MLRNAIELHACIHQLAPALHLQPGYPHYGHSCGHSWHHTLSLQPFGGQATCYALLTMQHPDSAPHTVAAVLLNVSGTVPKWFVLDSATPSRLYELDRIARNFDAGVTLLLLADPAGRLTPAGPEAARQRLRGPAADTHARLSAAAASAGIAIAGASRLAADGFQRPTRTMQLYAPPRVVCCRDTFLTVCRRAGLFCLLHAKFKLRGGTSQPHLLISIHNQLHLQYLATNSCLLQSHVRNHTGWRLVEATHDQRPPSRAPQQVATQQCTNAFDILMRHDTQTPSIPRAPHRTPFTVLGTFNVNGLDGSSATDKLCGLLSLMHAHRVGIMAVQEVRLVQPNAVVSLLSSCDATEFEYHGEPACLTDKGRPSGGSGFIVHRDLVTRTRYWGALNGSARYRTVWLTILGSVPDKNMALGNVYLPDSSIYARRSTRATYTDALASLEHDLDAQGRRPGRTLLLGDTNARLANSAMRVTWDNTLAPACGERTCNMQGQLLLALAARHDMCVLSAQLPAHAHPTYCGNGSSMIDHILATGPDHAMLPLARTLAHDSAEVQACGSDHSPLLINILEELHAERPARSRVVGTCLERLDDPDSAQAFQARVALHAPDWETQVPCITARDALSQASTSMLDLLSTGAVATLGTRTVVRGKTKLWLSRETAQLIKARRAAHLRLKFATAPADVAEASKLLSDLSQAARAAVRADRQRRARSLASAAQRAFTQRSQPRRAHQLLRVFTDTTRAKGCTTALRHPDTGADCTTNAAIVSCLVTHHSRLAARRNPRNAEEATRIHDAEQQVASWRKNIVHHPDQDADFTHTEVGCALATLPSHEAPGLDKIPAELLKHSGAAGLQMITRLFNTCRHLGCAPAAWRQGCITTIHKRGDRTDCDNYRGITLLPTVGKLFMSVLAKRLHKFAPPHRHQYAFVPGQGTTDASFNLVAAIDSQRLHNQSTFAFFLDIRKAFDTIVLPLLLQRLHDAGITGRLWHIIASMYDNTESCVVHDGSVSSFFPVEQGVAQGCPSSPTLFNVFLDTLLYRLHAAAAALGITLTLEGEKLAGQAFADDSISVAQSAANLQALITIMWRHSLEWLWDANVIKSHVVVFNPSTTEPPPCLYFGDALIPICTESKNLGLWLTSDCSWLRQIHHIKQKSTYALHAMRAPLQSGIFTFTTKLNIIKTCLIPSMTFGLEVWSPQTTAERTAFVSLDTLLVEAMHTVLGIRRGPGTWHVMRRLKSDVLFRDFAILRATHLSDAARARFRYRADPILRRLTIRELELTDEPPPNRTVWPLPADHPWLRATTTLITHLQLPGAAFAAAGMALRLLLARLLTRRSRPQYIVLPARRRARRTAPLLSPPDASAQDRRPRVVALRLTPSTLFCPRTLLILQQRPSRLGICGLLPAMPCL